MDTVSINHLETEKVNANSRNLDQLTAIEIVKLMNEEDKTISLAVENEAQAIADLVQATYESVSQGGKVFYVGAGTSGRLGILDASECPPTFSVDEELFQGVIAGGTEAIFRAKEGIEDLEHEAFKDLKSRNVTSRDMVIGLTASGRTPYVIGALKYAESIGATTGSVSCVSKSEVAKIAKYPVEVVTGAEVLTGSTRLKAGTAQKMVLNMISTGAMILSGKVYRNYMVDVNATNKKLYQRAINMLREILGADIDYKQLFEDSGHSVKTAIIMHELGLTKEDAELRLHEVAGHTGKLLK